MKCLMNRAGEQYALIGRYLSKNRVWCLVAVLMVVELVVFCWLNTEPDNSYEQYIQQVEPLYSNLFWFILIENMKSMTLMVCVGVVPVWLGVLWSSFFAIRGVITTIKYLLLSMSGWDILLCVLPHGVFELSALALSVVLGVLLSKEVTTFPVAIVRGRSAIMERLRGFWSCVKTYLLVCVPLLILGAIAEVTVSHWVTNAILNG